MLRRFETYAFLRGTGTHQRQRVADVLVGAGRHIPEVLSSAVGWNRSPASSELVWEHFFESPAAYQRYMVHPYHADLIDRYVLADSPERVVETVKGAGLFGYLCQPSPGGDLPARLVVLLELDPDAGGAAEQLLRSELDRAATALGAGTSGFGANSLGNAWFDGITPLPGPRQRWSHIWEVSIPSTSFAGLEPVLAKPPVRAHRHLLYDIVR